MTPSTCRRSTDVYKKDTGTMGIGPLAYRVCSESTIFHTAAQIIVWNQSPEIHILK